MREHRDVNKYGWCSPRNSVPIKWPIIGKCSGINNTSGDNCHYCSLRMMRVRGIIVLLLAAGLGYVGAYSTKKGVAVAFKNYICGDLEAFTNINWWWVYNLRNNIVQSFYATSYQLPYPAQSTDLQKKDCLFVNNYILLLTGITGVSQLILSERKVVLVTHHRWEYPWSGVTVQVKT